MTGTPRWLALALALTWLGGAEAEAQLLVDGRVVDTRADGPCYDAASRYVDCGNGTVTDTVTQLIWLRDASCPEMTGLSSSAGGDWSAAMAAVAELAEPLCGLTDGSQPGDWRLATAEEWAETIERAVLLGCVLANGKHPSLTNTAGDDCFSVGPNLFTGVDQSTYWAANIHDAFASESAHATTLWAGDVTAQLKTAVASAWPVRRAR